MLAGAVLALITVEQREQVELVVVVMLGRGRVKIMEMMEL